jgi:hypothetical protein
MTGRETVSRRRLGTMAATVASAMAAAPAAYAADEAAAKDVADAVRAQGVACADPVSAERDPAASKPDAPVWILTCGDARYRVRLRGDRPAEIETVK